MAKAASAEIEFGPASASSGRSPAHRKILVAEDDRASADVLRALLTERGHTVDVVGDGEAAIHALNSGVYDVVMVDFHLARLDGLEVAAAYRVKHSGKHAPRFIAISSDMRGLLEHAASCETFDEVVAKPFDLEDVCRIVEDEYQPQLRRAEPAPPRAGAPRPMAPEPTPAHAGAAAGAADGFDFERLNWPEDFRGDQLSARAMRAAIGDGKFRAIVVNQPATLDDLRAIWRVKYLHTLPIVDRHGGLGVRADFDGSQFGFRDREEIDKLVAAFENRRSLLHADFLYAESLADRLLARIFLSGGSLVAHHDPQSRQFIAYNCALDCDTVERETARLCDQRLLKKVFFDRIHRCDRCGSSRLNIREECTECHSPNLVEEPYLHHFRCAYQGLESDFRQGDALICPKCRRELMHYSVDYDKPGTMIVCRSCGHKGSEPAVGLLCMDCGAHTDGDQASVADIYSYELTERALGLLKSGRELFGIERNALSFAELPLELVIAVNNELTRYKTSGVPFTLLDISYRNARSLEVEHGARQFDEVRDLFLENLRSVLRKADRVVKGRFYDFALLVETDPDEARDHIDEIRDEAVNTIRLNLGVRISAHGVASFL